MAENVKVNYVDHICISVRDVLKAEQDYCSLFGWEVVERYHDPGSHINVSCFAMGPTTLEIMEDEFSGGWYELQDDKGTVVFSGPGHKTKWVKKEAPQPEGKMGHVGDWIENRNQGREGVQLVSFNVDDAHEATKKFKANGGEVVPVGGKDIQHWAEKDRNYSFLHPKKMHGIILEFIDGAYDWKKSK